EFWVRGRVFCCLLAQMKEEGEAGGRRLEGARWDLRPARDLPRSGAFLIPSGLLNCANPQQSPENGEGAVRLFRLCLRARGVMGFEQATIREMVEKVVTPPLRDSGDVDGRSSKRDGPHPMPAIVNQ
ncbi:MAG: hypothetical protein ACE5JU_20570, partial [Candidatus Binatia bacterium]